MWNFSLLLQILLTDGERETPVQIVCNLKQKETSILLNTMLSDLQISKQNIITLRSESQKIKAASEQMFGEGGWLF